MTTATQAPKFHRVCAGLYETADGQYEIFQLIDAHPPAWNVQYTTDWVNAQIDADPEHFSYGEFDIIIDGAASKRDAVALFADWHKERK